MSVAPTAARAASPATAAPERVSVALGERAYDILVGRDLLAGAGEAVAVLGARAAAIVTDTAVEALYAPPLARVLEAVGLRVATIAVPPGEGSKSFATLQSVCDGILEARIERGDLVVALGGGVVGDLAGFAAGIVRRGLRFVQVPTTLLAQVDSSVGGKTGINTAHGKNLVGAFHQPSLVLADTGHLDTLPEREFRAGFAEVLKYGLISDRAFFGWCVASWPEIRRGGPARERALLNLGHTFGHALERLVGYDGARLVHGEGVAIGIAQAFRFSARLGLCAPDEAAEVERCMAGIGLPTRLADVPGLLDVREGAVADAILAAMYQDKKVKAGRLTFILARGIGAAFVAPGIDAADVSAFLQAETGT